MNTRFLCHWKVSIQSFSSSVLDVNLDFRNSDKGISKLVLQGLVGGLHSVDQAALFSEICSRRAEGHPVGHSPLKRRYETHTRGLTDTINGGCFCEKHGTNSYLEGTVCWETLNSANHSVRHPKRSLLGTEDSKAIYIASSGKFYEMHVYIISTNPVLSDRVQCTQEVFKP